MDRNLTRVDRNPSTPGFLVLSIVIKLIVEINPILVAHLQKQRKPSHEHKHSGSDCQFDTQLTGIGLKL